MDRLQADIVLRLSRRKGGGRLAQLIGSCKGADCTECGDVCPLKAAQFRRRSLPAIKNLFSTQAADAIWDVRLTKEKWSRERNELECVSLLAIEKYIRRGLDTLQQPSTVAFGMIDAWYEWQRWKVGARLIISGPSKSEIIGAFPTAALAVDGVAQARTVAAALLRTSQQAKALPLDPSEPHPKSKRRGEYYAWLASCAAGSRLFRYGCDRHFNQLKKTPRPYPFKPKKRRPYPHQLERFMFGNHPEGCLCIPCGGPGLYRERWYR